MIIDCSQCPRRKDGECDDCFVMEMAKWDPKEPLDLDPEEEKALAVLKQVGLAPVPVFRKKAG